MGLGNVEWLTRRTGLHSVDVIGEHLPGREESTNMMQEGRGLGEWGRHEHGIRKPGANLSFAIYCRLTPLSFSLLWTLEIMHVRSPAHSHGSCNYLTMFFFGGLFGKGVRAASR